MKHFSKYSIEDFNDLLSEENHITDNNDFGQIGDKIEADGLNYFYISMNPDVEEAIENESEIAQQLGLNLIEVEGDNVRFFIATY